MARNGPVIGRHGERAALEGVIHGAAEGHATAAVIEGPGGIGKSTLLAAVSEWAAAQGVVVLETRAEPFERDVALATLRDAIRSMGSDDQNGLCDAGDARSFVQHVRACCEQQPVLVAIDDVHHIDRASASVLASLLRGNHAGQLAVIGTVAKGASWRTPFDAPLRGAGDQERRVHVSVGAMSRADAGELASSLAGESVPRPLERALWTATRGHPGYIVEAMRTVSTFPTLADAAHDISADPTLLILATPAAVSVPTEIGADGVALAKSLSAMDSFGVWVLPVVADVAGLQIGRAADAFDELFAAGVIAPTTARDEYEFAHPIVRSTIHAALGPANAQRIHAAIAQRMRARDIERPHAAVALAPHVAMSAERGDEAAVAELVRAADIVVSSSPALADEWYGHAEAILWPTHPQRGSLAAGRLRCRLRAGRFEAAVVSGTSAITLLAHGTERQQAAADLTNALVHAGRIDEALSVADEHLERGPVTAGLLVERARTLALLDRYDAARRDACRAIAMAPDDLDVEIGALGALVAAAHSEGLPVERDRLLDRQLALTSRGTVRIRFESLANAAAKLAQTGSLAAADEAISAAETLEGEDGTPLSDPQLDVARATVRFATGDWDVVGFILAMVDGDRPPAPFHRALLLAKAAEIHTCRGEVTAADDVVQRLAALPTHPLLAAVAAAGLHLARDEPGRAVDLLTDRCAIDARRGRRIGRPWATLRLVEAHVAAGHVDEARRWTNELQNHADTTRFPLLEVCAARASSIVGHDPRAAARAVAVCGEHGYVFEEARSRVELAELQIDPIANLTAAHDVFAQLGATPWRRRVAALMRARGKSPRRPGRATSERLTETEDDLVRHLRAGMSNRQIANAMSLSPKTIEAYLTRLYAKVGAASRVELVVRMSRAEALTG